MSTAPRDNLHPDDFRSASVLSVVVWTAVTVQLNLIAIALIGLTAGTGIPIPISLLLILAINILLPQVFYRAVGVDWARLIPAAVWVVLTIAAASPTSGGDLLIPGSSYSEIISLLYLGLGALSVMVGIVLAKTPLRTFRRRPTIQAGRR